MRVQLFEVLLCFPRPTTYKFSVNLNPRYMKTKITLFSFFILIAHIYSQQGINYKAIISDANGEILANKNVTIQFSILENGATEVFKETHSLITDSNGIIIANIGQGVVTSGNFIGINWGDAPHYLNTAIDKGDGFIDLGTSEFKTVPYAQYAKTSGNSFDFSNFQEDDILQYDGQKFAPASYQFYYKDNDNDNFGDANIFVYSPMKPHGFTELSGDLNDNDPNVNPGGEEICDDGIDNDSDGEIDEGCDIDNDGYSIFQGDCDDNDANINPGETERCDNRDNDCNGIIDDVPGYMVDNNWGSRYNSTYLGTLCGDKGFVAGPTRSHIGENWYRIRLEECNSSIGYNDLIIQAEITSNENIQYSIYLYDESGVSPDRDVPVSLAQSNAAGKLFYSIEDTALTDNSQTLYLEIRWESGISCENWTLKIWGDQQ